MPEIEAGAGDGELAAREASEQTQQAGERNAMELAGMDTLRGQAVEGSLKLLLFVQGVWTRTQGGWDGLLLGAWTALRHAAHAAAWLEPL